MSLPTAHLDMGHERFCVSPCCGASAVRAELIQESREEWEQQRGSGCFLLRGGERALWGPWGGICLGRWLILAKHPLSQGSFHLLDCMWPSKTHSAERLPSSLLPQALGGD